MAWSLAVRKVFGLCGGQDWLPCMEYTGSVLGQWKLLRGGPPQQDSPFVTQPGPCWLEDLQEDLLPEEQLRPLWGDLWREGFYGKG